MILSLHGRIRVSEYRILLILCSGLSSPLNTVMDEEIPDTGQQMQDRYRYRSFVKIRVCFHYDFWRINQIEQQKNTFTISSRLRISSSI